MKAINYARARSRYPAKAVEIDGIVFASIAESVRYGELKLLQRARQISELQCHPPFDLHVYSWRTKGPIEAAMFTPDFMYLDHGRQVVEEVKSVATQKDPAYRLRKLWFEAEYDLKLIEVIR